MKFQAFDIQEHIIVYDYKNYPTYLLVYHEREWVNNSCLLVTCNRWSELLSCYMNLSRFRPFVIILCVIKFDLFKYKKIESKRVCCV